MALVTPAGTRQTPSAPPAPEVAELEATIGALTAEQLHVLAQRIVAKIMDLLNIDISYTREVEEEFYSDASGALHPVMATKYDRDSRFMKMLLPLVEARLRGAFSNPREFCKHGIKFLALNSRNSTGIVYQIEEDYGGDFINVHINRFKSICDILLYCKLELILSVSKQTPKRSSQLRFDLSHHINEANIGHNAFTIEQCERSSLHATVDF